MTSRPSIGDVTNRVRSAGRESLPCCAVHLNICRHMAATVMEAAGYLGGMIGQCCYDQKVSCSKIRALEYLGDILCHWTLEEFCDKSATALEQGGVFRTLLLQEEVLDHIDGTAARIVLYKIPDPIPGICGLIVILVEQTQLMYGMYGDPYDVEMIVASRDKVERAIWQARRLLQESSPILQTLRTSREPIRQKDLLYSLYAAIRKASNACTMSSALLRHASRVSLGSAYHQVKKRCRAEGGAA